MEVRLLLRGKMSLYEDSWNVNGLGNLLECKKIKALLGKVDPSVVFIQEQS